MVFDVMPLKFILDTDHVSLHQRKAPLETARIENCPIEELAVTVVTRNISDFEQVPGLKIEDWSQ